MLKFYVVCFCLISRADFSKEPAFSWMNTLSEEVKRAIKRSRILFCNGYDFDELSPHMIISAVEYAVEVGTSVFFDPGPRGKSLLSGTAEEEKALKHFLRMSDVLLLTSDEVLFTESMGIFILFSFILCLCCAFISIFQCFHISF